MDQTRFKQAIQQLLNNYVDQLHFPNMHKQQERREKLIVAAILDQNARPVVIEFINKALSIPLTRSKGLRLLEKTIVEFPPTDVLDHAIFWANSCVNVNLKQPNSSCYNVLVKILKICSGAPDFNKAVITLLPKVIDMCIAAGPDATLREASLECLTAFLQKYPSTCSPFSGKIEVYLCKYFQSAWPLETVGKAGSAFHFLQQAGGSGPDGTTHRDNWTNQIYKLCSTMHTLYHTFLARVTEFKNNDIDVKPFQFALDYRGGKSSTVAQHSTAVMLKNVVIFLNCMLVEPFPVEKAIPMNVVVDVINRGLLVDTFMDSYSLLEEMEFSEFLYAHQIDLLYLLRSLIARYDKNIMPFSFVIMKMITDCLQRTQKQYFRTRSEYKRAVYIVLNSWIVIGKNQTNKSMHNKLVSFILSDITPLESRVLLCLNENCSTNKSAKAKRKAIQQTVESNSKDSPSTTTQKLLEVEQVVCVEALKTASTLLQHVVLQLNQDSHKMLVETVVQQIKNIQEDRLMQPYTNSKCQVLIYEMFACMFSQPIFCMTPLLQTGINLFTKGCSNPAFSTSCMKGLALLEKLSQPICPTLHINQLVPLEDDSVGKSNKRLEFGMSISDTVKGQSEDMAQPILTAQRFNTVQVSSPNTIASKRGVNVIDDQIVKQAIQINNVVDDKFIEKSPSEDELPLQEDNDLDITDYNSEVGEGIIENTTSSYQQNGISENVWKVEVPTTDMEDEEMMNAFVDVVNE